MSGHDKDPWSVTANDLRRRMRRELDHGADGVVVTVADVEGAAYRRPGAKMLVGGDGSPFGAVTAGCLEDSISELAMDVLKSGEARRETFDMLEDEDDTWGLGLGCNGIVDILLEPLDASWRNTLERLDTGEPVTMLTVTDSSVDDIPIGARSLVIGSGEPQSAAKRATIPAGVVEALEPVIAEIRGQDKAKSVEVETEQGTISILVDGIEPVPKLLLFGCQPDIHPVARVASDAGFEVIVHSPRGARGPEEFPHADHVETGHPSAIGASVAAPEYTYAVVMAHNLIDDRIAVETLLSDTSVPYVGLMGPRDRFERLREESDAIGNDDLERIATPVGLDLGGGDPSEIALSVVSEVLAVSNGRAGTRLKNKKGPVHTRLDAKGI